MPSLVVSGTPWEVHKAGGVPVHVKREDLCCPEPGPSFSKVRGVAPHIQERPERVIGALDTYHSKAGWGVAYLCRRLARTAVVFWPRYKGETGLRENQRHAAELGAELKELPAGRSAILYHQARKWLKAAYPNAYMLPNALKLPETVDYTSQEVVKHTPVELFTEGGTWVISISSGTIAAGVIRGLLMLGSDVSVVLHMGYSRSKDATVAYIRKMVDHERWEDGLSWLSLQDEGYGYRDAAEGEAPFPCNEYYDLKAWRWLEANAHQVGRPIVFWNIGA